MGREVKRVPLDFSWPLDKVWDGYLNPHYGRSSKCDACDGTGYGPVAKMLYDQWYGNAPFIPQTTGSAPYTPDHPAVRAFAARQIKCDSWYYGSGEAAIAREAERLCRLWNAQWCHHLDADDVAALLAADRLWDFTRVVRSDKDITAPKHPNGWLMESNGYVPTPQEVNDWGIVGFGHDSCNAWACVKAKAKRMGHDTECLACHSDGRLWPSPEAKHAYESWEPTEPPVGKGWQFWETVTEGSPQSPVFATPIGLENWLVEDQGYSREGARAFVESGWVPSMVITGDGKFLVGVESAVVTEDES